LQEEVSVKLSLSKENFKSGTIRTPNKKEKAFSKIDTRASQKDRTSGIKHGRVSGVGRQKKETNKGGSEQEGSSTLAT